SFAGVQTADGEGRFRVEAFAGRYKIQFFTPDQKRTQFFVGSRTFEDATTFTVKAGQDTVASDRLLPAGSIRVTAVDVRTGHAIADFCASTGTAFACSDGSGAVVLTDIVIGPAEVMVTPTSDRFLTATRTVT